MKLTAWMAGLALVLAGCAAGASAPAATVTKPSSATSSSVKPSTAAVPADGRVIGTFLREGGPLGAGGKQPPNVLLKGTVQFFAAHHRTLAVRVGRSGRFAVWLPAGTYRVSGRSPSLLEQLPSGAVRETTCSALRQIAVVAGGALRITVICNVP